MRLVLVHGINQQGKNAAGLTTEWLKGLRQLAADENWPKPREVVLPFYGDVLHDLAEGRAANDRNVIAQGGAVPPADLAVSSAYAEELRVVTGITEAQIAEAQAELDAEGGAELVVPQGSIVHNRRTKAILRAIEKISPFHGDIALRILGQAHAYLTSNNVTKAVDKLVRPALEGGEEMVVVAHSLGTIVTYKLLREMGAAANVKLYMTLGSPLGLAAVRKALRPGLGFPAGVKQWVNGGDPDDFVALYTRLKGIYDGDIVDLDDIHNGDEDKHAIVDYLANASVSSRILSAIA